jgi:hypothetical protein
VSDIAPFFGLGFRHITDLGAMDHLLFLIVLAAVYHGRTWRDAIWVVSAFTLGHSITLGLAVSETLPLPTALIEFLIPLTILATGLENILVRDRTRAPWHGRYRPVLAGGFGLVHGAGFANYLRHLFEGSIAGPLLGFNLGIEAGQIVVLAAAALGLALLDRALALVTNGRVSAVRLRTVGISAAVTVVAGSMAAERLPW